ncbi:hypothetical protein F0562_012058 [Nyssa sinensis]|uniref:Uncharacterized protein n=1 Tax=Nyssa sinensis TaxID=561372 RepID=A0A5J4ZSG5_9ASTE|nr:hypothetical protein F0562_012058 [Nyssa sinensis]
MERQCAMKLINCISNGHPVGVPPPPSPTKENAVTTIAAILTNSPNVEDRSIATRIINQLPANDTTITEILCKSEALKAIHEVICSVDQEYNWIKSPFELNISLLENALAALLRYTEPTKPELQLQMSKLDLEQEDGAKVVRVENVNNPYKNQVNFNRRFKLTLNKLYAWSLVDYDRVVMLDSDNLFLQKTDELFQCGQFCAVFINLCIFHTGLFILQPSMDVFKNMLHELEIGRKNPNGADQGFIGSYFPDLLDQPMFHPPLNGPMLDGTYRLPLGYQMDASYYCMYAAEMPIVLIQSIFYLGIMAMARLGQPSFTKLCYRRADKNLSFIQIGLKMIAIWSILAAYIVPFFLIPRTVHPLLGWTLYLLGAFALSSVPVNAFLLPMLPVLVTWLGKFGALLVMACPWYPDGVVRALAVFGYAFCYAPVAWVSLVKVMSCLQVSLEREAFLPRLGESSSLPSCNKLY